MRVSGGSNVRREISFFEVDLGDGAAIDLPQIKKLVKERALFSEKKEVIERKIEW